MRRLAAFALAALLAACTDTIAARQAALAPYIGKPEQDLVRDLGVPSRSIETGGHRYLAYTELRGQVISQTPVSPFRPGPFGPGLDATVTDRVCETTFDIAAGKVAGFTFKGNAC